MNDLCIVSLLYGIRRAMHNANKFNRHGGIRTKRQQKKNAHPNSYI